MLQLTQALIFTQEKLVHETLQDIEYFCSIQTFNFSKKIGLYHIPRIDLAENNYFLMT